MYKPKIYKGSIPITGKAEDRNYTIMDNFSSSWRDSLLFSSQPVKRQLIEYGKFFLAIALLELFSWIVYYLA